MAGKMRPKRTRLQGPYSIISRVKRRLCLVWLGYGDDAPAIARSLEASVPPVISMRSEDAAKADEAFASTSVPEAEP